MPSDDLGKILGVVNELAQKAAGGDYIFRGETQCYPDVSSSLYRDLPDFLLGQVEAVQEIRLSEAKDFASDKDELEILTELQHFGGKTNLIDFTTDCGSVAFCWGGGATHIALFNHRQAFR